MSILEKFKIPKLIESDYYVVRVVEQGIFGDYLNPKHKQHLFFCLCEESYRNDIKIESIINFNGSIRKILNSDVVIEKIGEEYFVIKNRHGPTTETYIKVFATPIFQKP